MSSRTRVDTVGRREQRAAAGLTERGAQAGGRGAQGARPLSGIGVILQGRDNNGRVPIRGRSRHYKGGVAREHTLSGCVSASWTSIPAPT